MASDSDPANEYIAVTPSDTVGIQSGPSRSVRALYIGVGGDVVAVSANGNVATFKNVASGQILPVRCVRVNATNTTATNIVALT